jgi:NDP-sugar pyrophosphorylase family protein
MQAVLLAGGKGTRLRPFAASFPKPLVPLGDMPVLEILVRRLRVHGFDRLVLAVGHLAPLVEAYFQDGARFGVEIRYARELEPLGTAGPLGGIEGLDDDFLVMNGDLLTDMDFRHFMEVHRASGAAVTVARCRQDHQVALGVLTVDADGSLVGYEEKPVLHYDVSMGAYAFRRDTVQRHVPAGQRLDMPDLLLGMVARGERVATFLHEGFWLDIGRPDEYARAQDLYESNPARFLGRNE